MSHKAGILVIGDDDAGDALGACVGVEGVLLLFDILSLAWLCAFRHGLCEHGEEFAYAASCEAGEGGELGLGAELDCGLVFISEYSHIKDLHGGKLSVVCRKRGDSYGVAW